MKTLDLSALAFGIVAVASIGAVFAFARGVGGGTAAPGILANVFAGVALGGGVMAVTALAAGRAARKGPLALWKTSVLGVVARMAVIGLGVAVCSTAPWFNAFPFVFAFGAIYLAGGLWLVMAERASFAGTVPAAVFPIPEAPSENR